MRFNLAKYTIGLHGRLDPSAIQSDTPAKVTANLANNGHHLNPSSNVRGRRHGRSPFNELGCLILSREELMPTNNQRRK